MIKVKTILVALTLACICILSLTAYHYRDEFSDRDITNLSNESLREASDNAARNKSALDGIREMFPDNVQGLWSGGNDDDSHVVMGKLRNDTLRAQLGQRTWYLLHVMASRYPEDPTRGEIKAMENFMFLLSRLYPCGDCAHHFQQHLKKHPVKAGSRDELEQYLCSMHNVVNKVLNKPLFDCSTVHDEYDCGCGPDEIRYKPGN